MTDGLGRIQGNRKKIKNNCLVRSSSKCMQDGVIDRNGEAIMKTSWGKSTLCFRHTEFEMPVGCLDRACYYS